MTTTADIGSALAARGVEGAYEDEGAIRVEVKGPEDGLHTVSVFPLGTRWVVEASEFVTCDTVDRAEFDADAATVADATERMARRVATLVPVPVTGEWLPEEEGGRRPAYLAYRREGEAGWWNGAVVPLVTREVAERIAAAQAALNAADPEDCIATLTWDGDVLVYTDPDAGDECGPFVERHEQDENGLYEVGLGWMWEQYRADEQD